YSGLAVDREQVGALVAERALVGVAEEVELGLPADERRLERPHGPDAPSALRAQSAPRPDRLGDALQLDGPEVLDLDAPECQAVRARAEQQLAGLRNLLEARGERDGLAGGERGVAVLGHDLTRLDADPRLQLELFHCVEDP